MGSRKIYISGPMSGLPFFNFPAFFDAEFRLRQRGFEVFNPARHDIEKYGLDVAFCPKGTENELFERTGNKPSYRELLKKDLLYILDEAEVICMLPGWTKSKGARVELALAEAIGLEVMELDGTVTEGEGVQS